MDRFPGELIYILIIAVVLLVQYLMRRFGRRPQEAPLPEEQPAAQDESLEDIWRRAPAVPPALPAAPERVARLEAPAAGAAIPRRRSAVRSLLGGRRELRRAIIIMTALGPCRAFEPHDIR